MMQQGRMMAMRRQARPSSLNAMCQGNNQSQPHGRASRGQAGKKVGVGATGMSDVLAHMAASFACFSQQFMLHCHSASTADHASALAAGLCGYLCVLVPQTHNTTCPVLAAQVVARQVVH